MHLYRLDQQIVTATETIAFFNADIEGAIATDSSLKNDQQRKARRIELQQEPDYLTATNELKQLKAKLKMAEIELNFRRNQFSALKLQLREQIARAIAGCDFPL